jgi:cyclic beta-1,2-glucan synthetase
VFGWTIALDSAVVWTSFGLFILAFPIIAYLADQWITSSSGKKGGMSQLGVGNRTLCVVQLLINVALLPQNVVLTTDAVVRTLVRLGLTRRNLLEWTSASQVEREAERGLRSRWRTAWAGPALAIAMLVNAALALPNSFGLAIPFAALWLASPALVEWLSRPAPAVVSRPEAEAQ